MRRWSGTYLLVSVRAGDDSLEQLRPVLGDSLGVLAHESGAVPGFEHLLEEDSTLSGEGRVERVKGGKRVVAEDPKQGGQVERRELGLEER